MLKFFGFDLELFVDQGISSAEPEVHSATSLSGEHWLIVQVDVDPDHLVWTCAPVSARALREVGATMTVERPSSWSAWTITP